MSTVNRVVILGAESSGKSILAEALAAHYQTIWVPEYLREFVEQQQRVPRQEEQILIARTQLQREAELASKAQDWLFCDTGPCMTAIYSRHYFGDAGAELDALDQAHQYDFTIVTAPDFPWMPDGLQRESAAVRQLIHEEVLNVLEDRDIPFLLVEGSKAQRLEQVQFALSFLMM
ncbi:ATP-binding protein [Undibacterium sp. CY18W]|uniref:ATP-binding protein n=1 Tax=Undibacterium hunanense TaxID=2762292 RepID=A0ABR6ZUZ0_9BURK|nr:ATP-binding protein [Undibacterium hunanense]MBC3919685.1 ATP-binding protein [Undibacterium hunanense]